MPDVTNPLHDCFPQDDRYYRIFWGGETLLPEAETSTPRTRIWLKEVNEAGAELTGSRILQITESAGAIPRLAIGSYWRNGRRGRPKYLEPDQPLYLEIEAQSKWSVVRAGDPFSGSEPKPKGRANHCWVNPSDLRLSFSTSHGRKVNGHHAWIVPARTTSGQEVLIPSYEIFRALIANTTDLSLALLSGKWDAVAGRYVISSQQDSIAAGISWRLDLAPGVPHSAVPYLALLTFSEDARRAANAVYPALVRQGSAPHIAWISAFPPFVGRRFRMRAHAIPLPSRDALLVTQIVGLEVPIDVTELTYSVAMQTVPVGTPGEGDEEPKTVTKPERKKYRVSKPGDRRPGIRLTQLPAMSVRWSGLPIPKRTARRTVMLPIPEVVQEKIVKPPKTVSVGKPGSRGSYSPARYTPQEEREIEDRFQEIRDLVEDLISNNRIKSVTEYPLVRPAPAESPTYCEFPMDRDGTQWGWSIVRAPLPRARLAMVLELSVEGRLIYWIETETTSVHEHYCSLAVETVSGDSLDEGMLCALLDTCAYHKGVWPQKMPFGDGSILTARARHTHVEERQLSPNVMLLAFARLVRKRHKLGVRGSDGNTAFDEPILGIPFSE